MVLKVVGVAMLSTVAVVCGGWAQERPAAAPIDVQHYVIDAEVNQSSQSLTAVAQVRFVPQEENLRSATFQLNNALNVSKVEDGSGQPLTATRNRQDFTISVTFAQPLPRSQPATITFHYDGRLTGKEESPVFGIKFASIQPDYAFLMYPARWFPVSGYTTDRFTSELRVVTAEDRNVVASGSLKKDALSDGRVRHTFQFNQPSFPASFAVVQGQGQRISAEGSTSTLFFRSAEGDVAQATAAEVGKIMTYFASIFGLPLSANPTLVETEVGAPAGYSAPGIIFLSPNSVRSEPSIRVLANQLARQWWGMLTSPTTREHIWIPNGLARYAELLYIRETAGDAVFDSERRQAYIDALTIDNIPVIQASRYDDYSPEFWALSGSKGAAVFHMLRQVLGDDHFFKLLKAFADEYAWKSADTADLRKMAENLAGQELSYFFIEWIQSTGAPEFDLEYTVFRTQKGFRIMGKVTQDLDTFRMPVALRILTEGNPESQVVEVVGPATEFVVETFGKPTGVELDSEHQLLRYDNDTRVAVAIRRGEQFAEIGEYAEALREYQKALDVNRNSSHAHYRIAEIFFLQSNYQSAANEFREALNGDLEPAWTEVWSHINLGKIFDVTGQRDRALNEYRQAVRTKDNTQGAQEEAAKYLQTPYEREGSRI
jgi:tetratricopeptide (TPR) repeat protein